MICRIASLYSNDLAKTDISFSDEWSIRSSWKFLSLLLNLKKKHPSYVLSKKFLPGNRFEIIKKINTKILDLLVRKIISTYKPYILWLYNAEFYNVHNRSNAKIVVFSCDKMYLQKATFQMSYRELFEKGWVFAYLMDTVPKPLIFKKMTQTKIISELTKMCV